MNKPPAKNIDRVVADIMAAMSLKEKSIIANMGEKSLPYLEYAFDAYIAHRIGNDEEYGRIIIKHLWETLRATHRLRIVVEK